MEKIFKRNHITLAVDGSWAPCDNMIDLAERMGDVMAVSDTILNGPVNEAHPEVQHPVLMVTMALLTAPEAEGVGTLEQLMRTRLPVILAPSARDPTANVLPLCMMHNGMSPEMLVALLREVAFGIEAQSKTTHHAGGRA